MRFILLLLLLPMAPLLSQSPDSTILLRESFARPVIIQAEGEYLLYLPPGYDSTDAAWPLVLFLHGSGERGSDLSLVMRHGPPRRILEGGRFPFILVAPQCPAGEQWSVPQLSALLDHIEAHYRVDPDRIHLTGLSMGGFAVWNLAYAEPRRFASLAPVCGTGLVANAAAVRHIPVWLFHGEDDDLVPVGPTRRMEKALRELGADVRCTIYPGVGHDSWTATYANPGLYQWMLNQRRHDP